MLEVSCGDVHTIVLTLNGKIYTMGDNSMGQQGFGLASFKGNPVPTHLVSLKSSKMVKVRAGQFSASQSEDGQLYVWGEGFFGKFYSPHKIKSLKSLEI